MTYYLALRGRDAERAGERDLSFLAKATDQLDLLCDALQVTSVKDFVSRWCKASDGLHTCQLVLETLMSNEDSLPQLPRRSTDWLPEHVLLEQTRLAGFSPEVAAATREALSRPKGLRVEQLPRLLDDLEYVVSWLVQYEGARFRLVSLS